MKVSTFQEYQKFALGYFVWLSTHRLCDSNCLACGHYAAAPFVDLCSLLQRSGVDPVEFVAWINSNKKLPPDEHGDTDAVKIQEKKYLEERKIYFHRCSDTAKPHILFEVINEYFLEEVIKDQ